VWCGITPFEFRLVAVIHPKTDKIELGWLLVIVTNFKHILDSLYCSRCLRNKDSIDLATGDTICFGKVTIKITNELRLGFIILLGVLICLIVRINPTRSPTFAYWG
jgi:hypothetical protein